MAPSRYAIVDAGNRLTSQAYERLLDLVRKHGEGKVQPAQFEPLKNRALREPEVGQIKKFFERKEIEEAASEQRCAGISAGWGSF